MECQRTNSHADVTNVRNKEDQVMLILYAVENTLGAEIEEKRVGEGIYNFCCPRNKIVILPKHGTSAIRSQKPSHLGLTSSHQFSVDVTRPTMT